MWLELSFFFCCPWASAVACRENSIFIPSSFSSQSLCVSHLSHTKASVLLHVCPSDFISLSWSFWHFLLCSASFNSHPCFPSACTEVFSSLVLSAGTVWYFSLLSTSSWTFPFSWAIINSANVCSPWPASAVTYSRLICSGVPLQMWDSVPVIFLCGCFFFFFFFHSLKAPLGEYFLFCAAFLSVLGSPWFFLHASQLQVTSHMSASSVEVQSAFKPGVWLDPFSLTTGVQLMVEYFWVLILSHRFASFISVPVGTVTLVLLWMSSVGILFTSVRTLQMLVLKANSKQTELHLC